MADGTSPAESPAPAPSPVLWVLVGILSTLAVLVVLRVTEGEELAPEVASAVPSGTDTSRFGDPAPEAVDALSDDRADFAQLYVGYLLKSYYVRHRGFCPDLLEKLCRSMLGARLLDRPSDCRNLPNDAFVLAIGRYQNKVGLPVDGKAGPETVRMMLGGDFSNREGMAAAHCKGPPAQ